MPLTDQDSARLYADAFQQNAKAMLGESAFANADLKTQLDVARYAHGVTMDELAAVQKELADLKSETQKQTAGEADPAEA